MSKFAKILFLSVLFVACDESSKTSPPIPAEPTPTSVPSPVKDRDGDNVMDAEDCAPGQADLFQLVSLLPDRDSDGYGFGVEQKICIGNTIPKAYVAAGSSLDCDDENKDIYQEKELWMDADNDAYTLAKSSSVCIGRDIPRGYRLSASAEPDCDDQTEKANALGMAFPDADLDGRADRAEKQLFCLGSKSASYVMTSEAGLDCAPGNSTLFESKDLMTDSDGDFYAADEISNSVCVGTTIPKGFILKGTEKGLDQDDGNSACWKLTRLYVDQDRDGQGGPEVRDVCTGDSIPEGYSVSTSDCNDQDKLVRWPKQFYVDADRDEYTTDTTETLCASAAPRGYQDQRSTTLDCDDQNPQAFVRQLGGIDKDRDGYPQEPVTFVCFDRRIHRPFPSLRTRVDCDDNNDQAYRLHTFYIDADKDGFGSYEEAELCTNNALDVSAGYVELPDDCDDKDPKKWDMKELALDRDHDGFTGSELESLCVGKELPKPYLVPSSILDCNDQNNEIWRWTATYRDSDNDGIGAGQHQWQCLGRKVPQGYSLGGYDPDDKDGMISEDDALTLILP